MHINAQTRIVAGNGPAAFRGIVADIPLLIGFDSSDVSRGVEVLDATSSMVEVSVKLPTVERVLEAEVEHQHDGTLRIKSVYDPTHNHTVCF